MLRCVGHMGTAGSENVDVTWMILVMSCLEVSGILQFQFLISSQHLLIKRESGSRAGDERIDSDVARGGCDAPRSPEMY